MSNQLTIENKEGLYASFSVTLILPVILWPLVYQSTPFLEGYFYFGWVMAAGSLLLIAVMADSIFSGMASMRSAIIMLLWVVCVVLVATAALNLWNGIYLIGVMWFLHSLRSCIALWFERGGWWSWSAWIRDCLTSLSLFLWQPFLSLS